MYIVKKLKALEYTIVIRLNTQQNKQANKYGLKLYVKEIKIVFQK